MFVTFFISYKIIYSEKISENQNLFGIPIILIRNFLLIFFFKHSKKNLLMQNFSNSK